MSSKSDRKYEAKELARLQVSQAVSSYFSAADAYEMGAMEIADELSDTIYDATDKAILVKYADE